MKALIIQPQQFSTNVYAVEQQQRISQLVELLAPSLTPEAASSDKALLAEAEIIFCTWGMFKLDQAALTHLPKLKMVYYAAGSVNYLTTEAMWARGIRVSTAQIENATPVAEWCLGMILLSLKSVFRHASKMRHNEARHRKDDHRMPGAYNSVIGIVSVGSIARKLIELLKSFQVTVLVSCPFLSESEAAQLGVERVTLDALFQRSDVISLHTALNDQTNGMITGKHIAMMRPESTLINSARGGIIKQDEMVAVLSERKDLFAVLDVTDPEPLPGGHPLYLMPNVLLTPHIAGAMQTECLRLADCVIDECERHLNGEAMLHEVKLEDLARRA